MKRIKRSNVYENLIEKAKVTTLNALTFLYFLTALIMILNIDYETIYINFLGLSMVGIPILITIKK